MATTTNNTTAAEETRNVRVNGNKVTVDITVRKTRDSKPVSLTVELDYEGITARQILIWATRSRIIDVQRALRACNQETLEAMAAQGTIRRKAVNAGAGFVDPAKQQQQIIDKVANMSAEERAQLMALLANM